MDNISPRSSVSFTPSGAAASQIHPASDRRDSLLDDRIPLHRRSVEIRNSEIRGSSSRSSSTSSQNISRSRSRVRRASYSSIKEDDTEVAQTFITSEDPPLTDKTAVIPAPPDFCCPCGAFKGWKHIPLSGKKLSKSHGDLKLLGNLGNWAWEEQKAKPLPQDVEIPDAPRRPSKVEQMPFEILEQIVSYLSLDLPPNGYTPRNQDLISCLLSCKAMHSATLGVLYRNITIPHSIIFFKALSHITTYPSLGTLVRRLDFSHFTSVGLGRTKQMNADIQNVTSKTLLKCLELVPHLREFLVQEHLDDDLSEHVLVKLFLDMPLLRAVDFCSCSSRSFTTSMSRMLERKLAFPNKFSLRRISFHECSTLPRSTFETLLPLLSELSVLDVFHTSITDDALFSIPSTARMTHLNLGKCTQITGPRIVEFLTTHPSAKDSLIYLNLMSDISRYRLFQSEEEVSELLSHLPPTLRSLNLTGARITSKHIPLLLPLTKHLEELSLGFADLTIKDINSLFVSPSSASPSTAADIQPPGPDWTPCVLHYLDLTSIPSVTAAELFASTSILTSRLSSPLCVIELDAKLIGSISARLKNRNRNKGVGWVTRELGRRGWFVREPEVEVAKDGELDDGRRNWKMGARWWGMRKVGVAVGEVGGLYGHYMFKK